MLIKQCIICGKPCQYPDNRCSEHKAKFEQYREQMRKDAMKSYDTKARNQQSKKFYNSSEWKLLSKTKLMKEHWRCEECGGIATEVHHIVPIRQDWSKRLEYNNLKALCDRCHKRQKVR